MHITELNYDIINFIFETIYDFHDYSSSLIVLRTYKNCYNINELKYYLDFKKLKNLSMIYKFYTGRPVRLKNQNINDPLIYQNDPFEKLQYKLKDNEPIVKNVIYKLRSMRNPCLNFDTFIFVVVNFKLNKNKYLEFIKIRGLNYHITLTGVRANTPVSEIYFDIAPEYINI